MGKPLRILIVEDSEDDGLLLLHELRRSGYDPVFERVDTAETMRSALEQRQWDIVISDYVLPKFGGLAALNIVKESGLDLPFIIVSGKIGEDIAVGAMKAGAHDYLIKGNVTRLVPAVERELREAEVRRERRRAELQLDQSRQKLFETIENISDGFFTLDQEWRFTYVNTRAAHLWQKTREELMGKSLWEVAPVERNTVFYEQYSKAMSEHIPAYFEAFSPLLRIWVGARAYPSDVGISVYFHDITERKRLQSIAEAANTMNNIGYVFSGISHEIGNPISSLIVNLEVMKEKLDGKKEIAEYVDRAMSQVSKIEFLLNSLRTFNMFEVQDLKDVNVASFIDQFLSLISEDFTKKGIAIGVSHDAQAEWMHSDPRALQQVLLNVFTNAVDALDNRPCPKISVRTSRSAGFIRIRIEDNGCGMTVEQQEKLFKPFHTNKPHGTGLGMVIVKNMLSKMGGTIEVESRKDAGTGIDITIPEGGNGKR